MASYRHVTYQDVATACDTLVRINTPVSQRAIRNILGSGSMTTISKYLAEWRKIQDKKVVRKAKSAPQVIRTVRKRNTRVANSSDITDDTFPPVSEVSGEIIIDTPPIHSNLIHFPSQITVSNNTAESLSQRMSELEKLIEKLTNENEKLQSAVFSQKSLKSRWREKIKSLVSPDTVSYALKVVSNSAISASKLLLVLSLIGLAVWLSAHISGEFFGSKGFETATGVLFGGGILSFLARSSESFWKASAFRSLAYLGTAGFLLVAFSGIKDRSLKESESYVATQKAISSLEAQVATVSQSISALPADYGKLREKEYARQDKLKRELEVEKLKLASIAPNASADLSVVGNFIARFILDVLVFALFEVLAVFFVSKRKYAEVVEL